MGGLSVTGGTARPQNNIYTYRSSYVGNLINLLILRPWTDETVIAFVIQPDTPRNVILQVRAGGGGTCTGTVVVSGFDANGARKTETFTVNNAGNVNYTGSVAFALLSKVETDRTDVTVGSLYSLGFGDKLGYPNYPWIAGKVFKVTVNGADVTGSTIDLTNGTVDTGILPSIAVGDIRIIWVSQ